MTTPRMTIVLCEGYDDRAFWSGLLELRLGFEDARPENDRGKRGDAVDVFGRRIKGEGRHALRRANDGAFVIVRPCGGRKGVLDQLKLQVDQHAGRPLSLIVSCDHDAMGDEDPSLAAAQMAAMLRAKVGAVAPPQGADAGSAFVTPDGKRVTVVLWSNDGAPPEPESSSETRRPPELPRKQTLERLVCSAIRGAYPDRAAHVGAWLATRPAPPASNDKEHVKSFAYAHLAGWFARHGCDDFFRAVWRDEKIAAELEARMRKLGAWRAVEEIGT